MWHNMQWHGWDQHMFSWWAVIIMGVLIVVAALIIARSQSGEQPRAASGRDAPLDILERRYARGEIDHEEFEEKKRDLQENR